MPRLIVKILMKIARIIHIVNYLPDKVYLKMSYMILIGKRLNFENPLTYNEKLQWLKINDRKDIYTRMVDKYAVKDYVGEKIGYQYLIPTLGIWDSFDDIDFETLPNQFVLKCTHDSGGLVICKDKKSLNIEEARRKINNSLKTNYYYIGREWPYKNVKPRIIAEEYMEDNKTAELRDYKFFCFNGICKSLFIATDRQDQNNDTKFDFFDSDFNHLDFRRGAPNANISPQKPSMFNQMVKLAEVLSKDIPHIRVDFYEVNGKIYFGELTFYPGSGFELFSPSIWDEIFGRWLVLPEKRKDKRAKDETT